MIKGSTGTWCDPSSGRALDPRVQDWTWRVIADNDALACGWRRPRALGHFRHVIDVIKENRTCDEVLTSLGMAEGTG